MSMSVWKQKNCFIFSGCKGIFLKIQWAWQDVKLTWLISIFTWQKSLVVFDKNLADKIQFKKDKGIKVPSLMPIMLKVVKKRNIVSWKMSKHSTVYAHFQ